MIPKSYIENYIKTGKQFPPDTEAVRLSENKRYQLVFDGKFLELFPNLKDKLFMDLVNKNGEIERFVEATIPNFPSLIERKFSNLAFGKTPSISHETDGTLDKKISDALEKSNFWSAVKRAFVDSRVFGNGILDSYNTVSNLTDSYEDVEDLEPVVTTLDVNCWCPVCEDTNKSVIVGHLIGAVYKVEEASYNGYRISITYNTNKESKTWVYNCSTPLFGSVTLKEMISGPVTRTGATNYNRVKVLVGFNTTTSYPYGISTFRDYYDLVAKLMNRFSQVANILDKHAMPMMSGPKSVLDYNEDTGEWTFNRSAFVGISPEDAGLDLKYVTWDAQLDACFKDINNITKLIYQMSESGADFLDDLTDNSNGFAPSARALKIRQKSPISAVNAWITENQNTIKKAVEDVCKMSGVSVKWTDLELSWTPNLPEDELEKSQIFMNKMNAGFSFVDEAMREYGMTYEGAKQEFEDKLEEGKKKSESTLALQQKQIDLDPNKKTNDDGKVTKKVDTNPDTQRRANDQIGKQQ